MGAMHQSGICSNLVIILGNNTFFFFFSIWIAGEKKKSTDFFKNQLNII